MEKAIVLIDFQNEWVDKKSSDYIGDISSVLEKTNRLIDMCRKSNYKIIFTRHVEIDSGPWSEKSNGTKIISSLHMGKKDKIITKHRISPFYKTRMSKELSGIKEIIVCGILTNMCVRSFIHDAYDIGFTITLVKDCCVAPDKKTQDFTIKDLKFTRPEIKFVNARDIA